jgi:FAD:protein FMN transferase
MSENKKITRRQFLQIIAAGSVAGLALKFGVDKLTADEMVSETRLLMGTVVNLTIISDDPVAARSAIRACLERMSELEAVLSRFQPESQLSRLNRTGAVEDAHPALLGMVRRSIELGELTGGAFDITVKPLLDLYQVAPGLLPTAGQIGQALKLVGYRNIDLSGQRVAFRLPGMSVTLDGIAKGFIVDEGVAVLRQFGFTNVMVEAGGDLMGMGKKAPHSPWMIGLQAPRTEMGDLMATFNIQNQAIATSGDYMQAFTSDFANHHIIDPRSGHSSPELASASVIAPTAAVADGLATAVMVIGLAGLQLIEGLSGCEAYVVTKDIVVLKTSGFQES